MGASHCGVPSVWRSYGCGSSPGASAAGAALSPGPFPRTSRHCACESPRDPGRRNRNFGASSTSTPLDGFVDTLVSFSGAAAPPLHLARDIARVMLSRDGRSVDRAAFQCACLALAGGDIPSLLAACLRSVMNATCTAARAPWHGMSDRGTVCSKIPCNGAGQYYAVRLSSSCPGDTALTVAQAGGPKHLLLRISRSPRTGFCRFGVLQETSSGRVMNHVRCIDELGLLVGSTCNPIPGGVLAGPDPVAAVSAAHTGRRSAEVEEALQRCQLESQRRWLRNSGHLRETPLPPGPRVGRDSEPAAAATGTLAHASSEDPCHASVAEPSRAYGPSLADQGSSDPQDDSASLGRHGSDPRADPHADEPAGFVLPGVAAAASVSRGHGVCSPCDSGRGTGAAAGTRETAGSADRGHYGELGHDDADPSPGNYGEFGGCTDSPGRPAGGYGEFGGCTDSPGRPAGGYSEFGGDTGSPSRPDGDYGEFGGGAAAPGARGLAACIGSATTSATREDYGEFDVATGGPSRPGDGNGEFATHAAGADLGGICSAEDAGSGGAPSNTNGHIVGDDVGP